MRLDNGGVGISRSSRAGGSFPVSRSPTRAQAGAAGLSCSRCACRDTPLSFLQLGATLPFINLSSVTLPPEILTEPESQRLRRFITNFLQAGDPRRMCSISDHSPNERGPRALALTSIRPPPRDGLWKCRAHVRRALRYLRCKSRLILGRAIAQLISPTSCSTELARENISSILICRINGRLGNTVLLTPLVRRIHELLPHASIDLAIAYPQAAELLDNFPGVRRVIVFPHKGLGLVRRYFGALRRMRAERYDLVIDPVVESTGGRIAITLSRAHYRVGFESSSQWAPLTHAIPEPDFYRHQAVLPVYLLCQVIGMPYDVRNCQLSLCLRPEEIESGLSAISRVIEKTTGDQSARLSAATRTIGFFAHATGLKAIDRGWWLEFWEAFLSLEPDAIPVEFLPLPHSTPTDARFPSMHCPSTRALSAAITATRMFISADTGPMHLASATPVPTVALFHASDPAVYGPLKSTDLAINIIGSTPRLVAQHCQQLWRESTASSALEGAGGAASEYATRKTCSISRNQA
jgi:heptosyltransferase III